MKLELRLILLSILLMFFGLSAYAQESKIDYSEIPQSRTEDGGFVLGSEDAEITLVEFADFLCSHCQDYHENVVSQLITDYVATGLVRLEYRVFPVIDDNFSPLLGQIAECIPQLTDVSFWEIHDELFNQARDKKIATTVVQDMADQYEIAVEDLQTCIDSAEQYKVDQLLGSLSGVTGTPAMRVRVGDSLPQTIVYQDQVFSSGGFPLVVIEDLLAESEDVVIGVESTSLLDETMLADDSVVTGEPCAAPCWQGLTPGVSTWAEAEEILAANELVPDLEIIDNNGGKVALWSSEAGSECCNAGSMTGENLDYIQLLIASDVTVGELIETYGEPDLIRATPLSFDYSAVTLIWSELPFVAIAEVEGDLDALISADNQVFQLIYLTDDVITIFAERPDVIPWQGYVSVRDLLVLP